MTLVYREHGGNEFWTFEFSPCVLLDLRRYRNAVELRRRENIDLIEHKYNENKTRWCYLRSVVWQTETMSERDRDCVVHQLRGKHTEYKVMFSSCSKKSSSRLFIALCRRFQKEFWIQQQMLVNCRWFLLIARSSRRVQWTTTTTIPSTTVCPIQVLTISLSIYCVLLLSVEGNVWGYWVLGVE